MFLKLLSRVAARTTHRGMRPHWIRDAWRAGKWAPDMGLPW